MCLLFFRFVPSRTDQTGSTDRCDLTNPTAAAY